MKGMRAKAPYIFFVFLVLLTGVLPVSSNAQDGGNETLREATSKNPPSPFAGARPGEKRPISLSFDHMDIVPVLDEILGEILQVNYAIDPAIKGSISLRVKGSYSKESFMELLNSILDLNGLAITKARNDLYKVVRKVYSGRATSTVQRGINRGLRPGDQIVVLQPRFLNAAQTVNAVRNFISASAVMIPEPSTNSIIFSDTKENVEKVVRLISLLDSPPFKGVNWKIFPLKATEAKKLASDLEKIFKSPGLYARPGQTQEGIFVLPLESINSVLVASRWPGFLNIAEKWIKELDKGEAELGTQVHVYFVQNGRAKDIVDVLNQLYGGTSSKGKQEGQRVLVKREKRKEQPSGELTGEVEIIADEVNNAIIIKASQKDYETISKVLRAIDVMPRQVLIEVLIAEVTLNKDTKYGVEWYIKSNGISSKDYQGGISLSTGHKLATDTMAQNLYSGFSLGIFKNSEDLRGLLNTISSFSNVNILSSPTILSVDNKESSIEVGDEVPTLTGTQTNNVATTQSIQYRNAGIILKVKPYINDRGLVRLEVTQEVSSVENETTGGITSPRFSTRKITTTLVAEDGQTIVIGGLMKTQKERSRSGIPILKDLPVLGYVFGSKTFKNDKTELLIAITPHVIQSRAEADAATREFREKVKELKKMLKKR